MRFSAFLTVLLLFVLSARAQDDSIGTRVILVGDAGALVNGKATVLDAIRKNVKLDKKTVVVYLGDNLYTDGLPHETLSSYSEVKIALDSQINLVRGTGARAVMIPGNHDWENGGPGGYDAVRRQGAYVDLNGNGQVDFQPKDGCPGPVEIKISDDVVLVVMDSQWWIHKDDKPGIESDCEYKTEEEVLNELGDIFNKNFDKLILFATHHPFKSNGPHGGYYTLKQHIFPFTDLRSSLYIPLPVIGSVYPIARSVFGTPQDLKHPTYLNMVNRVMGVVKSHPHVIMMAGHEHALQLLRDSSYNYIVSGSGCKTSRVSPGGKAEFTARALGFATLDIHKKKTVRANFYKMSNATDSISLAFSDTILDFSKLPPVAKDTTQTQNFVYKDYALAVAGARYKEAHGIKRAFNGSNYRKEWSTPVQLRVFNINKEKGGFKIDGIGGGKQTKSLKLIDKDGVEWALRTVDKDPEQAIPQNLRESFAAGIVQDMISAAHPYAPLTIPTLAKATGVTVAEPEFFLVPDDPALGYYRPLFANQVCLLEKRELDPKDDSKSSFKLFNKMREDNDHTVDQQAVLRARVLDLLIADWDRHFDQWRWATKDTGQGKLYEPIPRDRDQAFFHSNGLIVRYVSRRRIPYLKGLRYNIREVNELNMVAKDFDRIYMNSIDRTTWDTIVTNFTARLSDETINEAMRKMPPEIYAIRGQELANRVISRRNQLREQSLRYYKFLSKEVNILGSNEAEKFTVTKDGDKLLVTVYSYRKNTDTNFVMYRRSFDPKETQEIRMFGFNGNDKFDIDTAISSKIRILMIGGRGDDSFFVKSRLRSTVYDNNVELNYLRSAGRTKQVFSSDPTVNEFQIRNFNYPVRRYPRALAGFNADDGLMLGTGFWITSYRFRKTPFASDHQLYALAALMRRAYQVRYKGEIMHAFGKLDLVMNGQVSMPVLNNFFGFGNNTKIDKSKDITFYRVRYKFAEADLLLRRRVFDKLSVSAGPTVFHYWNRYENNEDYILGKPSNAGLDSTLVYSQKTYVGAKASLELDNLNSDLFPTRGIRWVNKLTLHQPVNKRDHALTKIESDMVVYASLKMPAKVVGVIKMGAGHIFNDSIQYFQALNLGQNNVLRGFRKNRFSGHSMAYGSLELRIKLFDSKSYIFPGQVGLVVYNDIGRVWYKGEDSKKWHYVAGGGFYYNPFNLLILSATVGFSKEEQVFNFSLGSKFNLTF